MAGKNRALQHIYDSIALESYASNQKKPCVFLSHISVDKSAVRAIGKYLMENGDIDIYLDENDEALQAAVKAGNPHKVTEFIEKGLSYSSHIMCLVSNETSRSWWVPYEIGFAKKSRKKIASLLLKGNTYLPDYLKISEVIEGTKSLNQYIDRIENETRYSYDSAINKRLVENSAPSHPLDDYLNWQK